MQRHAPARLDRLLDREPRELVAERDGAGPGEDARGQALLEGVRARRRRAPPAARPRRAGARSRPLRACGARRAEPRGARRARRPAPSLGIAASPAASTSVTKNGLPDVCRYSSPGRRRPEPRARRLPPPRAAPRRGARRAARVASSPSTTRNGWARSSSSSRYVTITSRWARPDAARQQAHDVERRLVGPVQVLDDDDRRTPSRGDALDRRGDGVRRPAALERVRERSARLVGGVEERPERPRREERVAGAPEDRRRARLLLAERAHERGLADARLARDERRPPAPLGGRGEGAAQDLDERIALEERGPLG